MQPQSPTDLSLTGKRWQWPEPLAASPAEGALPGWLQGLLARRGITADREVSRYLSPSLQSLEDPSAMADMDVAVARLRRAIAAGERITVWGDYDVDGVCSTTVMVDYLRRVGANVGYYIPDRRAEGYGLNESAVRDVCATSKVLVTTDCGITAVHEIAVAQQLGTDVIVVDHHQVGEALPPAHACLDPHRPDCEFPFKGLCATGVAFMLVGALRRAMREAGEFGGPEPDLRHSLDVVAVATVADMVPIVGTNRVLLAAGLKRMAQTQRVGLRALLAVSQVDPAAVTATDLGFRIGPRINARGRISHAAEAVELLLTSDPDRARVLAGALDLANRERRDIEKQTLAAALEHLERHGGADHPALVLYDPTWHPGVLGLVATRLTQRLHRPAIVIGEGGKGSGRSVEGLDLHAAMSAGAEHLLRFGGHTAAAGCTVLPENIDAFRESFCAEVERRLGPPPYVGTLRPDVEVDAARLELTMVDDLERLAPFGQQNPEPLLVSRALPVRAKRVVGGDHLKLELGNDRHDAIAFGLGRLADGLPAVVDVAYRIERNTFRGQTRLQLRVADLRPA